MRDGEEGLIAPEAPAVAAAPPGPGGAARSGIPGWVAGLDPGYFAWVMASGIVSIGAHLLGRPIISDVTFVVTGIAFVVLIVAYAAKVAVFTREFVATLRNPSIAMGYFTLVAGCDVLAVRLVMAGHPTVALALAALAAALWAIMCYGIPWSIMIAAEHPSLRAINGTWLIWVVATQSISVVAGALATSFPWAWLREGLPIVAVVFWAAGTMLYVCLITIVFLRLFLVETTPPEMGPAYWITMGATAISVRAAAGILAIHDPASTALVETMRPVVAGLSVVLWAFGTWWIPMLVLFGIWRHVLRRYPLTYEPRLWSVVFPLGMYTVASYSLGATPGLGFMQTIADGWVWVDVAAWTGVMLLLLGSLAGSAGRRLAGDRVG